MNLRLADLRRGGLLGVVEERGATTVYLTRRVDGLGVDGAWEPVARRDWAAEWREGLEPVTVGAVTVAPPWRRDDVTGAGHVVVIQPGQAFGTGHHQTTRACLGALQELAVRGRRVLDVGTGSGVLALAAALLGAAQVVAVDVDPVAVAAARSNARDNGLSVDVRHGSLSAAGDRPFDILTANLDTAAITCLAGGLAAALADDGTLVASGIEAGRQRPVTAALVDAGLRVTTRRDREWVLLRCRPRRGTVRDTAPGRGRAPGVRPGP
ncbi:MAG: 50S ribosomal protein L11 methyltransferase [Actinobacteria bacterium]|nr:50S ribosomal protein L11 methyltransferase [Actinomycetota bacterium]